MPLLLPDFHLMIKGKFDYSLRKRQPVTADTSIAPGSEVLELVWENGRVLMQGLLSEGRKDKASASLLSPSPKTRRGDVGFGKSVAVGDAQAQVPSAEMAFSHDDDDLMPWLNYPAQHEHCSDLLPEPSGVTANNRNSAPVDRRHRHNQMVMDRSCTDPSYCSSSSQSQLLPANLPHLQPKASDCSGNVLTNALPVTSSSFDSNQTLPIISSALMNFSHFSRPAALVKAHLHKHSVVGCLSAEDKPRGENKGYSLQSKVVEKSGSHAVPSKAGSLVLKPKSLGHDDKLSDAICQNELSKKEENHKQRIGENASKRLADVEKTKTVQPSMASSVCSANAGERMSKRPVPSAKRKCHEVEESEFHSEDMEDCFEVKKVALARGGSAARRNRVAEVHNLSERRRRDKINEKMRALQELIPNCNKVDKASMLDEAIDYLKALQFQVQFMSMGAGMYMPSMMLPFGLQQNLSCMGHFSHPGVGFGMRDMNGGSSDQPMVPMQAPHFPLSPSSLLGLGGAPVHGMVGSNLPLFGLPAQGLPMFAPPGPPPSESGFRAVVGVNACNAGSKDQMLSGDRQNPDVG